MYRLAFVGWHNPNDVDLTGYQAQDYLKTPAPEHFVSMADGVRWIFLNFKGADPLGVWPIFKVLKKL